MLSEMAYFHRSYKFIPAVILSGEPSLGEGSESKDP
jgi:hypothetical protein